MFTAAVSLTGSHRQNNLLIISVDASAQGENLATTHVSSPNPTDPSSSTGND